MGSRLEQKSNLVRKRIEAHTFDGEQGDEYEGSKFGGFTEYFRRKKIKLQNLDAELRAQSDDKPKIFRGVVCHVNGYTQPSLNDLHTLIVQHGGGFVQYLDGKTMVTHIIASNLTPKKKEEFKRYRIVKPAWVVESVNAGKLLPWDAYRVIDEGIGQKVLGFQNGQVVSQANKRTKGYREQTDTSWYTSQLKPEAGEPSSQAPAVSRKSSAFSQQPLTPNEDIEDDDEFPLPEITSSVEQAIQDAEDEHNAEAEARSQDGFQMPSGGTSTLRTPPLTSPAIPKSDTEAQAVRMLSRVADDLPLPAQPEVPAEESPDPATDEGQDQGADNIQGLRPREGSQEPDYEMAIVKNSETIRAVSPSKLAKMTAEEHNALLLADPRIRKSTVVNPDFLEQYYRESRLHHLSTWKADLKAQLQALTAEKSSSQKTKLKRLPGQRKYIMHVDFDSFFAAVSLKKHPEYKHKPAVVAHGGGSGSEIASGNYPAREFGIKNGMWMKRAQELCPDLKILPYDFPAYEEASRKFYEAILATGGIVQSVSIDEALVDISALCIAEGGTDGVKRNEGGQYREQHKADELAQRLRDEVFEKTGCAVSVGIGANVLLAKVALRKAKPAGQYHLKPDEVLDFIGKLEVQALPGIAWSIGGKLEEIGIKLVKDIRDFSREKLINTLGPKTGEKIWDYARGIDRTEVGDGVIRKSVSAEVNWGVRFENQEQVDEFLESLSGELQRRLLKERVKGKQLTMKVMVKAKDAPLDPPKHLGHGKCDTHNKSVQLGVATNDKAVICKESLAMMRSFGFQPGVLRGIGVQMQKLEPIKSGPEGAAENSQCRLQFKTGQPSKPAEKLVEKPAEDPIQDDVKTPQKQRIHDVGQFSIPANLLKDSPSKRPLNTLGTQFVLPTQVDPKVLAELPEDIRAKLAKHVRPAPRAAPAIIPQLAVSKPASREQSPAVALPNQSQLDPSILNALPEDVRAEVLGFYNNKSPRKVREQAVLPQSPRKVRTLPPGKKPAITRKRGGGLFAGRSRSNFHNDNSTLTQSNFVAKPSMRRLDDGTATTDTDNEAAPAEIDPEFLAALPEEVRREVLDQQRQARLQRTGGINISMHQKRKRKAADKGGPIERLMKLPPRPPKPSFTMKKLTSLPDLRKAVKAWYLEFSDEGPYEEDVTALIKYLQDVVAEERDMEKAVAIVKWMAWVVEEGAGETDLTEQVKEAWENALITVKGGVQDAVVARGLGKVYFG